MVEPCTGTPAAGTTIPTMSRSRLSPCSGRSQPMSPAFLRPSIELAVRLGWHLIVAPFAAAMTVGGMRQIHETCARHGNRPGRLVRGYFVRFADTPGEEATACAREKLQGMPDRGVSRRPGDGAVELPLFCRDRRPAAQAAPADLTENSALIGPAGESATRCANRGGVPRSFSPLMGPKPHA